MRQKKDMLYASINAKGLKKINSGKGSELRKPPAPYNTNFASENDDLRLKNTYYWEGN